MEEKSLRVFVARGTNLSHFKITIEVEPKKHSVAASELSSQIVNHADDMHLDRAADSEELQSQFLAS